MESGSSNSNSMGLRDYKFTFESTLDVKSLNEHMAVDPHAQSNDSQSLASSINDFPEEFGRTYHAYREGSYVFPNDNCELDRLNYQNEVVMAKLLRGRLHLAPFSKYNPPRRVLDVATGTGDWVIQMGDEYPSAYVEGIDLSPIQPQPVPPNVRFFVQDAADTWGYSDLFDFIHTRWTLGSFSDFKNEVVQQAFDNLEPGGWFESLDLMAVWYSDDGTLDPHGALTRWFTDINMASELIDRPLSVANRLKEWYEEVGFVDVQERVYKMPSNGWPADPHWKETGQLWERNLVEGLSGFSFGLLGRVLGWNEEQIRVSLIDVRREIQDTSIHSYEPIYFVWGRKPFDKEMG